MSGRRKQTMPASQSRHDAAAHKSYEEILLRLIASENSTKARETEHSPQELIDESKSFAKYLAQVAEKLWEQNYYLMQLVYFSEKENQKHRNFYTQFFCNNPLVSRMHIEAYSRYEQQRGKIRKQIPKGSNFEKLNMSAKRPAMHRELRLLIMHFGTHLLKLIPLFRVQAKFIELQARYSQDIDSLHRALADTIFCLNAAILELAIMIASLPKITEGATDSFLDGCRDYFAGEPVKGTDAEKTFKQTFVDGIKSLFISSKNGSLTNMQAALTDLKMMRDRLNSFSPHSVNVYGEFVSSDLLNPRLFVQSPPCWVANAEKIGVINDSARLNLRFRLWNEMLRAWQAACALPESTHLRALIQAMYRYYMKLYVIPVSMTELFNKVAGNAEFTLNTCVIPTEEEVTCGQWSKEQSLLTLYGFDQDFIALFRDIMPRQEVEGFTFPIPGTMDGPLEAIDFMLSSKQIMGEIPNLNRMMLPTVHGYLQGLKLAYLNLPTNEKLSPLQQGLRKYYAAQYKPYEKCLKTGVYKKKFSELHDGINKTIEDVIAKVESLPDGLLHSAYDVFEFCKLLEKKIKNDVEGFISWLIEAVEIQAIAEEHKRQANALLRQQNQLATASAQAVTSPAPSTLPLSKESLAVEENATTTVLFFFGGISYG